eukprot:scaffold112921_cov36-Phaeocystis_antarctica.AAC.2
MPKSSASSSVAVLTTARTLEVAARGEPLRHQTDVAVARRAAVRTHTRPAPGSDQPCPMQTRINSACLEMRNEPGFGREGASTVVPAVGLKPAPVRHALLATDAFGFGLGL